MVVNKQLDDPGALSRRILAGEISAAAVCREAFARIDAGDPRLHAFQSLMRERTLPPAVAPLVWSTGETCPSSKTNPVRVNFDSISLPSATTSLTDSVPLPPSKRIPKLTQIRVAPLIGEAIKRIHRGESVGALFSSEVSFTQEMLLWDDSPSEPFGASANGNGSGLHEPLEPVALPSQLGTLRSGER